MLTAPAFTAPLPLRSRSHQPSTTSIRTSTPTPFQIHPPSATLQPKTPISSEKPAVSPPTATTTETILHYYRPIPTPTPATVRALRKVFHSTDVTVTEEICFNVALSAPLAPSAEPTLHWLLAETFAPTALSPISTLPTPVVEVGPRLNFQTAWSSNAVSICHACALPTIVRLEPSRRYHLSSPTPIPLHLLSAFTDAVHDRMTETPYPSPLTTFSSGLTAQPTRTIDILSEGAPALEHLSREQGLGFDEQDIAYYIALFTKMGRNPTNVELFDLAQSNSEHSRHWFFKGNLVIDGQPVPAHLLDVVRQTLEANPRNSVVAFADNSSTIRGATVPTLLPATPGQPSGLTIEPRDRDILFTAETHNFPSGVAPFPGAETGTGGRIRDTAATGIGSLVGVGTAGYCVGNLHIPDMEYPWEDKTFQYPDNLASPLQILIDASNGASDYGNKFGEPVINGFARTYGTRFGNGERREFVKPIMFSGGMGQMDHSHAKKGEAELGLLVVKIGGPAYRIGMGGGAASSMMQGENKSELDFNAVQRGDAEMAQKAYRVLRACVEMGDANPIVSIHDQGAGGNCNVVKELIYPAGAKIDIRKVWVGDNSLSALEIWGAEYQEQFGLLLRPEHEAMFKQLCAREHVVPVVLGMIDGSGRIVLWDEDEDKATVDLDLEAVLGDLPQKTFTDTRVKLSEPPFELPETEDVASALERVLSLMSVGSKRFLTTKVDRSVTGLVAQQQCVGPLQLPVSDFAITAQSHFTLRGSATSIGERPSITALSPEAMARISVGEMMTNLAGVKISNREDVKCEGNWMWAAKLSGDCASLYDAAVAMRDAMIDLGIAIDGGKDSLSMAAKCPTSSEDSSETETVRAPGTLVITGYATVENIEAKLTPDIKAPGSSLLIHVDIAAGKRRLGGSALAQVYGKLGDVPPDVDDLSVLRKAFDLIQGMIGDTDLLSYHDISDGGLVTAMLEMGFAGNCGLAIAMNCEPSGPDIFSSLFAEELGMVLEVTTEAAHDYCQKFRDEGVPCSIVAATREESSVSIAENQKRIFAGDIGELRDSWERTSFGLEKLQANADCVAQEQEGLRSRKGPNFIVPWAPVVTPDSIMTAPDKPRVAIIREEGSNGDREMSSAFHMAGFAAWDVSMRDIADGHVDLSEYRGVAFVGGFSYADVLDSAKGWAGVVRFNQTVRSQFDKFYARTDTFSLGICNGCQLMALLGRVPFSPNEVRGESQPRFIHNESGRYESRFTTVKIEEDSPAIMLKGMGGARLGVWVAHGEGKAYFPDETVLKKVEEQTLAPLKYVDDNGNVTQTYPANPNGSTQGIAALCSSDGRHLALMPHPERTVLKWQWGYLPRSDYEALEASPWLTMFQNAYKWTMSTA